MLRLGTGSLDYAVCSKETTHTARLKCSLAHVKSLSFAEDCHETSKHCHQNTRKSLGSGTILNSSRLSLTQ
ncbi:uncharacterized protein BDZ99DRAFT_120658 [Mytilinidion resinicola]|uniref:Uncharacterized protein n=1 Tax=Mytilinidion resinicola TaxID=574789 RepID=A0A6A6Z4L4_9PEZI|nr:uncharacterized protein BDZ99DRAFT_120658 [Mytilinidion resinicola]KAF2815679.1 hypothetical protein BDZ99DRAFT_120658 [Mytilinidion resinicola]